MLSLAAYAGLLIPPFMAILFFKTGDGVYLYGFNQVKFKKKLIGLGRRLTPGMIIETAVNFQPRPVKKNY